ncbi:hypothetical protein, variant [Phialophora macrospora]|uniref:Velvet domain-containing protein n=1 Tax=Phialophora macrospora TaxID=1851006 RepID=A0A0D2FVY7_9EURO|nr:hypothetical protein PV04_00806 [Phialophora macrospora]KIW72624.1 hypothetical protein, variant [Phialophora macrospora]
MYPSQQHNLPPPKVLLHQGLHTSPTPPPIRIPPPYAPYSMGQPPPNSNVHAIAGNGTYPAQGSNMSPLANGNGVPPSPSQASNATDDLSNYDLPDLPTMSRVWGNHAFVLIIQQQPQRARMCGFGDKDRRPITPPLIVKLMILDSVTNQEINYDINSEWSKLILSVDLWDVHGEHEDNCVRHNATAPSISATTTTAYPPISQQMGPRAQQLFPYDPMNAPAYRRDVMIPTAPASVPSSPYERPPSYPPNIQQSYNGHYQNPYNGSFPQRGLPHEMVTSPASSLQARSSQDMGSPGPNRSEPSKNLIGQCHSSLQKLDGLDENPGLFFIFQDLSVRTEGWFRLKCQLFALGKLGLDGEEGVTGEVRNGLLVECPCLASTFTKPFKVFSAKKFPGVVETTAWSEKFALQGIKIPIRKSDTKGKARKRNRGEDSAEDDDDEQDE